MITRRTFFGLSALLPIQSAVGQSETMRAFRDRVLEMMRKRYPNVPAKPGSDDGSIAIGEVEVNLDNIYTAARQLPAADREAAVVEYMSQAVEAYRQLDKRKSVSWTDGKSLLRPRLVPAAYLQPAPDTLRRPFAPGVLVAYAIDYGGHVSFVDRDDLDRWKVELDQVHDAAIAGLEASSAKVPMDVRQARDGGTFAVIDTDDSYDAARLVLPRFRARLLQALGEPIFVGIPNRDFLVAWSARAQFTTFASQVADDFRQQPYPITDTIFHVDGQGVRPATAAERGGR